MLTIRQTMRRLVLRTALKTIELPLRLASALAWWLESRRSRLQTMLANEEANQ